MEWFRRELGGKSGIAELVDEAVAADQAVPIFLPHLVRSLTPHPDTQASAAFIGLKSTTTRGAMFRAVLEGVAFEARAIADAMGSVAGIPPFQKILAIGGSLQRSRRMCIAFRLRSIRFAKQLVWEQPFWRG